MAGKYAALFISPRMVTCQKKRKRILSPHLTIHFSSYLLTRLTLSTHQMSLASHTPILFHSSFNFLHMSFIKPYTHIHFPTHISQQSSQSKQHITHIIFQFFHVSRFKHFHHFIPYFLHPIPQLTFLILQTSTSFQTHSILYLYSASCLDHRIHFNFLAQ